jgi:ATP-dependent helicase HrpA
VPDLPDFKDLRTQIDTAMRADRFSLRRLLTSIERAAKAKNPFDRNLGKLTKQLQASVERRAQRAGRVPAVTLNEELPIASRRTEIEQAIRENQVIIVCGETGSGKSTQLPLICLGMGRGVEGVIGHTQPRRIAARSVASRVADELGSSVGAAVGFKVRFTDTTSPKTYVKLMTDGILLAESQGDPFFEQYDTLIIDEAHERSLNIDFLLGRMKQILPRRKDLRLIITSATIDAARFAEHFGTPEDPAPVLEVAGRTYPVEIRYRPPVGDDDESGAGDEAGAAGALSKPAAGKGGGPGKRRRLEPDLLTAVLDAVDELMAAGPGDILIFMPTERDIHDTAKSLRGRLLPERNRGQQTLVLPLYARLSNADQNRIFQTGPHRRIVIATNVAESSLTVPGIRYVIDTGTARISRYAPRSRMQRLPIEPVSQASANQRAGRCGRVAPGICIRLYAEADYNGRDQYTPPEIQRTNLASVILQTAALKLGPLEEFPFLEPPRTGNITDGYRMLFELGALDEQNRLTEVGRQLSRLPVDPRVGRIVLAGHEENCLHEILIIAAALELQDPRERPVDQQQAADEAQAKFQDEKSDFLSYLKLWDFYHQQRSSLSRGQLRKACQQNFLSYNRLREWADIHHQLSELAAESGLKPGKRRNDCDAIHRALLTGFVSNIALLTDRFEYTAAGGQKVQLWPGSGLFGQKPKWIVAAELVETTKRYVRTVARINPDWIEPIAGHLVKRTHSDPEWDGKAGAAMCFEKATLFGLPVVPRRRTRFAKINPTLSREMLIRHGLVEGDIEMDFPFLRHNQRLMDELEGLQTRTRRYDLIVDDDDRFAFYDNRIPHEIADSHDLRRWLKRTVQQGRKRPLDMTKADLRRVGTEQVTGRDFPDEVSVQQMSLPLEYHLEPGSPEDGVTIAVPREVINQLDQRRLGWLVPGLIEEKVVALIKSLPKQIRRQFVPVPDTAKQIMAKLEFGQGDFEETVAALLTRIGSERITPADFQLDRLDGHLRMNVRVVDEEGETLATGRDLAQLRRTLAAGATTSPAQIDDSQWRRDGLTEWNFGDLPAQINVLRGGVQVAAYPSLIDQGESVGLRLFDQPARAAVETRAGIRRLAAISLKKAIRTQIDNLPQLNDWTMLSAAMGGAGSFRQNLMDVIVDRAVFPQKGPYPRSEADFQTRLKAARGLVPVAVQDVIGVVEPLMKKYRTLRQVIADTKLPAWKYAVEDVKAQSRELTAPGFLTATQWGWLLQYPRYLEACIQRLRKIAGSGTARDQKNHAVIAACELRYRARAEEHRQRELFDPNLEHYRWMIEELRVSLFAQELGTAIPVSEVRLERQWEHVRD